MRKRWVVGVLIAGLIPFGAPHASASSGAESCFISAINSARTSAGRSRLAVKSDLTSAARRHSARMANDGRIYHSGSGSGISGWTSIGENVGSGPSCTSVHRAFMNSSSHRANILRGSFNEVGVGVAYKGDTLYVTEIFVTRGRTTVVRQRVSRPARTTRARRAPVRRVVKVVKPVKSIVPVATAQPVNVAMLLVLVGLDAEQVNPATGRAMGV